MPSRRRGGVRALRVPGRAVLDESELFDVQRRRWLPGRIPCGRTPCRSRYAVRQRGTRRTCRVRECCARARPQAPRRARTASAARRPDTSAPCWDGVSRWSPATNRPSPSSTGLRNGRPAGTRAARRAPRRRAGAPSRRSAAVDPAQLAADLGLRDGPARRPSTTPAPGLPGRRSRASRRCSRPARPCRRGAAAARRRAGGAAWW